MHVNYEIDAVNLKSKEREQIRKEILGTKWFLRNWRYAVEKQDDESKVLLVKFYESVVMLIVEIWNLFPR